MALRRPLLGILNFTIEKTASTCPKRALVCQFRSSNKSPTLAVFESPCRSYSSLVTRPGENNSIFNLVRRYEDLIGLTEVKEAQKNVLQAESDFQRTQETRRQKQDEIRDVQDQLHGIRLELDKSSRGEDRYLTLLTREHALIKEEQKHLDEFKRLEHAERDCFTTLSTRLRESHEKERERGERTKYWSIIGSAIGAFIGIVGTTVNNRLRMREVKNIVHDASDPGRVQMVISQLSDVVKTQQQQVGAFVSDLKSMLNNDRSLDPSLLLTPLASQSSKDWLSSQQSSEIMSAIKEQDKRMGKEMDEIKKMIAAERGYSMRHDGTIVYVGPEMVNLLDQTEKNIETKIKYHTLVAVVAVYTALAITLPLLYAMFRGG